MSSFDRTHVGYALAPVAAVPVSPVPVSPSSVSPASPPAPLGRSRSLAPSSDAEAAVARALTGRPTLRAVSARPTPGAGEDRTAVEAHPASASGTVQVIRENEQSTITVDLLEQLRSRLREAEAREEAELCATEESGVRAIPTPENGIRRDALPPPAPSVEVASLEAASIEIAPVEIAPVEIAPVEIAPVETAVDIAPAVDPDLGLEIDVEAPQTLDAMIAALPEIEVALAPNSESNFYAGFDDEHPQGVFVATYQRFEVGTPVYAKVHLPGGYRFRTEAVVEWTREAEAAGQGLPAGVGLSMCGLDHRMEALVRTFVKLRKPIFFLG